MAFMTEYAPAEPTRESIDALSGPVVVEFGTAWCGYCQTLQRDLQELFARYPSVQHFKVEDGPGRPLGRSFKVKLWPNLVFMKDGQVVRQLARPTPAEVEQALAEVAG